MNDNMKIVIFGFMMSIGWYTGKGIFLAVGERISDARFRRHIKKRYQK